MREGETHQIRLLGEFELLRGGDPVALPASRKTRALFVYLLLTARPVRRERLCEMFFDIPDDPRAALRWSLSKIRAMLGDDADLLSADRERVVLDAAAFARDTDRLDPLRALEAPLPGFDLPGLDDYNLWLASERAAIDRQRRRCLDEASRSPAWPEADRARFAVAAEAIVAADIGADERAAHPKQTVRYCFAPDGARIAFAEAGSGPLLVKGGNWPNHLELDWGSPLWGRLIGRLAERFRLVRYDERGNGLSDWDVGRIDFDALVGDLEAVVDALRLDRFPLFALSQGCSVAIEYAHRHPERISHLILLSGYSTGWRLRVDAGEAAEREAVITLVRRGWGKDSPAYRQIFSESFTPSATHDELAWFTDFQKQTVSPDNAAAFLDLFGDIDVRRHLPGIAAPTLVLHARGDRRIGLEQAIELASTIPNATLVTLDSDNHILRAAEPATDVVIDEIVKFLS